MAREAGQTKRVRVAEGVYRVQRKDGTRYQIAIYHGANGDGPAKRKWHTLPKGTTLPQAKKAKRELEDQKHADKTKLRVETVRAFYEKWPERFPHRKESTVRHNMERVRSFVVEFGDVPLGEVGRAEARDWALENPSHYKAVRAFFTDAKSMHLIDENPFGRLGLPQGKGRKNIKVLADDEIRKLVHTAKMVHGEYGDHFADLILSATWTGLRPGELFALIPERVDLDKGLIYVEEAADNKTGRLWSLKTEDSDRQVVILPEAEKALRRVLEHRTAEEFLFQPQRARSRFYRDGRASFAGMSFAYYWHPVREAFTQALPESHWLPRRVKAEQARVAKAGQKYTGQGKLTLYESRHRFGTALGQAGALPQEISDQMGHKDGGQLALEVYCHFDRDHVQNRIRGLFRDAA